MVNLTNTHLVRISPNTTLIFDPRSIEFTEPNRNLKYMFLTVYVYFDKTLISFIFTYPV